MTTFLDMPEDPTRKARICFLPFPLELTTSYGKGTSAGPRALLEATTQVEDYVYELDLLLQPEHGFRTLPPFPIPEATTPDEAVRWIADQARPFIDSGAFCIGLGGEHTITVPLVELQGERRGGPLTVVQIDAHADLRAEYESSRYSHACVARRIHDLGHALVQIGVRAFSIEEHQLASSSRRISQHTDVALRKPEAHSRLLNELKNLEGPVYLTLDVDGLDPSLIPGTGTPVPGGLGYHFTLDIIETLFRHCEVVGMDLVELAPIAGQHVSEFTCAMLLTRAVAWQIASQTDLG